MRNKLKANADYFLINALKIVYIKSRIRGEAALYLISRMREDAMNLFTTANELLDYLSKVYKDPNRRYTAMIAYTAFYQGKRPFPKF